MTQNLLEHKNIYKRRKIWFGK